MPDELNGGELLEVSLKELRLRPGLSLEVQGTRKGAPLHEAKFIAAIEGKGVMLTPSLTDRVKAEIVPGEEYVIRGFTGQSDFSFAAQALNVFTAPFAHALFAYPPTVRARKVRKSMRMKTALPATISPRGNDNPLQASIIDLSVSGAMVLSSRSLGVIGSLFDLTFPIRIDDEETSLDVEARLCHNTLADDGQRKLGLSFENLSQEQKLLLNYVVGKMAEENSFVIEA